MDSFFIIMKGSSRMQIGSHARKAREPIYIKKIGYLPTFWRKGFNDSLLLPLVFILKHLIRKFNLTFFLNMSFHIFEL